MPLFSSTFYILFALGALLPTACVSRPLLGTTGEIERAPVNEANDRSVLRQPLPNASAFKEWRVAKELSTGPAAVKIDPFVQPEKLLACETSDDLYPTHPQMTLKETYNVKAGQYDVSKLRGDDEACKTPGRLKNTKGVYPCVLSDTLNYVLLSDTYRDACGNLYRGYSEALYFSRNENRATLYSKGRAVITRSKAKAAGDVIVGETYGVPHVDFVMLTELNPDDENAIKKAREEALADGFEFEADSHLWKRRAK